LTRQSFKKFRAADGASANQMGPSVAVHEANQFNQSQDTERTINKEVNGYRAEGCFN
jgi:hypothetical protein